MIYYLGIIDCLTHYGFVKRLENFWRGLSHPKDQVSAIPPQNYGDRFFKFISGIVKSPEQAVRDKAARDAAASAAAETPAAPPENEPDQTQQVADRSPVDEEERLTRSLGTVRSPSAERAGGAAGVILPVVEEVGEGSSRHGSSRSVNGGSDSGGVGSAYTDGTPVQRSDSGCPDDEQREQEREREGLKFEAPVLEKGRKERTEDLAIRVARVEG